MKRALICLVLGMLGCGNTGTTPTNRCQTDEDCEGAQVCWCDHEVTFRDSDRCLDVNDLPAGVCLSRAAAALRYDAAKAQREAAKAQREATKAAEAARAATPCVDDPWSANPCPARSDAARSAAKAPTPTPIPDGQVPDGEDCRLKRIDKGDGTYDEVKQCTPRYRQAPAQPPAQPTPPKPTKPSAKATAVTPSADEDDVLYDDGDGDYDDVLEEGECSHGPCESGDVIPRVEARHDEVAARIDAAGEAMTNQQPELPLSVAPDLLEGLRTAGDKNIFPDDVTKTEIQRSGKTQLMVPVKMCIDKAGTIASVRVMKSSGFPAYDAKLNREIKKWRYRPFAVNGVAQPACTAIQFIYRQK